MKHAVTVITCLFLFGWSAPVSASHGRKCELEVELICGECVNATLAAKVLSVRRVASYGGGGACPEVHDAVDIPAGALPHAEHGDQLKIEHDISGWSGGESEQWTVVSRSWGCSSVASGNAGLSLMLLAMFALVRRRSGQEPSPGRTRQQ